jgi:hypothetical protein
VLPVGLSDQEIGRALQQRQQRDEEEEQPAPTAESKFQRYHSGQRPGRLNAEVRLQIQSERQLFRAARGKIDCCANFSGAPLSDGCQASTVNWSAADYSRARGLFPVI